MGGLGNESHCSVREERRVGAETVGKDLERPRAGKSATVSEVAGTRRTQVGD